MTRSMKALMTCAAMLGASSGAVAGPTEGAHPELGAIEWMRDFDAAQAAARQSGRPMLVLFDEVPGCHTCVSFGETTLSHPLFVEAAETLFTPVAVFNNIEGRDREVLNSFNEPTWNNPVIRVMDAQRRELAPRHADDYSVAGLAATMAAALQSHGQTPPQWLTMLAHEDVKTERATFAMHCFWEGEALLGGIEGVTKTRTGWLDNREVVE
ncbi:MAG: thioredoxin family protein, partial [Planctomycetota bacterium]|nr:thioredoxin family protein [Planctomycetota bacterium]